MITQTFYLFNKAGKMCCGRTPMATLLDGKRVWAEKNLNQI
ncbi:hypothetical protein ACWWJF_12275 [Symbiopectobacterium sp. Eva_TO]